MKRIFRRVYEEDLDIVDFSLRSWRDFARERLCFGSEALNESGEAVRGLVKSPVTRETYSNHSPRGSYSPLVPGQKHSIVLSSVQ